MNENKKRNVLIFVRACIEQEQMNWEDAVNFYFEKTKEKITRKDLKTLISEVNVEYLDSDVFNEYSNETSMCVSWPEKEIQEIRFGLDLDIKSAIGQQSKLFAITNKDLVEVFNVDLENDSPLEAIQKIDRKLADADFLLKYLNYDPGLYEINKIVIGGWTTPVKQKLKNGADRVVHVQNKKFSINIVKRKKPYVHYSSEEYGKYLKNVIDNVGIGPFVIKRKEEKLILNPDNAIVMPGLELHLGKLGTVADFEDYSTKHAMARLKETCVKLVDYQLKQMSGSLIMAVGNDFYNSDTPSSMTTKGTPQTNDTRFKEMYAYGQVGFIDMVETLKEYFHKLYIKHCPGNHDEKSIFDLYTSLYQMYKIMDDPTVEIGMSYEDIRPFTCQIFGDNLVVQLHGQTPDGKPMNNSAIDAFVDEFFYDEKRATKRTYVFAGHIHQDNLSKTSKGITVIRTAALSGLDCWHVNNGYISSREGHVFCTINKKHGLDDLKFVNVNTSTKIDGISRNPKANIFDEARRKLNLNPNSAEKLVIKSNVELLEKLKKDKEREFNLQLRVVLKALGTNVNSLSKEQLERIKSDLGYVAELERLQKQMEFVTADISQRAEIVKELAKDKRKK